MNEVKRGEIYYISNPDYDSKAPHEQAGVRPAVVVSNDTGNLHAPVVTVVPLTASKKKFLPTHVNIRTTKKPSTALCEQLMTVSKERLLNCAGPVSPEELKALNKAISVSLGLY